MDKKPLLIIFLVVFIDLVGFGIVIPILPYYAESFGASATVLGWLMVSYSGMQFIFSPLWGRLSDRMGRRPVLLTSIVGIGLSMVILGLAHSLTTLFVGRLLAGLFGANISTAMAYIADVTTPDKRARGMGLIGAAFGLGFLLGPVIGGFLSKWGYGAGPLFASGLALINFLFALFFLSEPKIALEIRQSHRSRLNGKVWLNIISSQSISLSILLFFIVTMGMAQLETTFALYLLERFGLDAFHAGLYLAMMALVMVAIQGGGIGRLAGWFGEINLILAGCLMMGIALFGAVHAPSPILLIPFLILHSFGYGITNPSLSSLTSRLAPQELQGSVMGVYHSAGSIARIIGPLIAGVVFDSLSIRAPFLIASGFFGLACVLIFSRRGVLRLT